VYFIEFADIGAVILQQPDEEWEISHQERFHKAYEKTTWVRFIKTHNRLNGIVFSIAEFAIITGVIAPFAMYYVHHARVLYALLSMGIILNCLTVVAFGTRQWLDKEQDVGWKRFREKHERERIARENPDLLRNTMIITLTALLPFILVGSVVFELLFHKEAQ